MTEPTRVQLYGSRGAGKTQALIESLLAQANERGIRVEVIYPQEARDPSEFRDAVRAERLRQIEKGYSPAHDAEHGLNHLLVWALDYAQRGEDVKASALIVAARELLSSQGEPCEKGIPVPESRGTVRGALVVQQSFLRGGADRVEVDACAVCGAIIFDVTLHNEWHADRTVGAKEESND